MTATQRTGKTKFFYGYWILAASLVSLFIMSTASFYSFGVFFKPIQQEFSWSRGVTSIAFLMIYMVQAMASPFVGRLAERYGPRTIITIGALILGLGLFMLSLTSNLLIFYAGYALTGLGQCTIGMIPLSALISNWFVRRRGLAMGIATTGVGFAGLLAAPIIGIFLIPTFGWRATYQILALLGVVLVATTAQLVIRTSPKDMGLYPDGIEISATADKTKNPSNPSEGLRLNAALKTSTFWFIVVAFIMFFVAVTGASQHLVNHLTDIGFSVATATTAFGIVGLGSTIGKFVFGAISDHLAPRYCASISFFAGFMSMLLLTVTNPTIPMVLALCFLLGISIGGWAPLTSMIISSDFGLTHYVAIYGVFTLFQNIGVGLGPTFFGYMYDSTNSYYWAYIFSAASLSASMILILASRYPKLQDKDH